MPYNSVISRTDAAALIPEDVQREILAHVPGRSVVMSLGRRLPDMPRAQRRIPVMSALATAYFVTGDTGLKQTTEVNWENKYIDAEEVAAIVPIPEAVLDDQDYDIWAEVRPQIEEAIAIAVDNAVLWGTNIPTTWTTDLGAAGLQALASAASQEISIASYTDLYEALLGETAGGTAGLFGLLESDGFMPTGVVSHMSMKRKLRNVRDSNGIPIFSPSMQNAGEYVLDGAQCLFPTTGVASATYLMLAGQWNQLVWAMRQDITFKVLDQAVIQDASGNILYNLPQQDMVALRAVIRLGFAAPNPINRLQATAASRCAWASLTA